MVTLSRNFVEKLAGLKDSSKFENLFLLLCNVRISTADFKILQKSSILTPLLIRLSGVYQEQINLEMISKYLYCDDLDFKFAVLEALSHIKDLDWILSLDIYSLIESAANCNHWFILISCANLISKLHSALKPRFIGDLLLGMLHKPDLVLNALEIMIRILGAREKSTFVDHQVCLAVLDIIISGNDRIASEKSFEIVAVIMERGSRLDVGILESAMASATSTKLEIFKLICHDLDLSGDINNINGACSVIQMIFQKFEPPRHFAKFKDLMDFLGPVLNSPCITRPELLKRNAAVDDTLELIKFCTSRLKNIAWQQVLIILP